VEIRDRGVEDKIRRWSERVFALGMAIAEEKGETVVEPAAFANPTENRGQTDEE